MRHARNIFLDLVFTVITFGLYNLYVQAKQMDAVNDMLKRDKYSFIKWIFFSIVTFGLYHVYHEFVMSQDIEEATGRQHSMLPVITIVLSLSGLHFVADAIQQSEINKYYGQDSI